MLQCRKIEQNYSACPCPYEDPVPGGRRCPWLGYGHRPGPAGAAHRYPGAPQRQQLCLRQCLPSPKASREMSMKEKGAEGCGWRLFTSWLLMLGEVRRVPMAGGAGVPCDRGCLGSPMEACGGEHPGWGGRHYRCSGCGGRVGIVAQAALSFLCSPLAFSPQHCLSVSSSTAWEWPRGTWSTV